jgi:UDP-N-acetylmuramate--alanine ligase
LAALCVGLELGIPYADAAPSLERFPGVARRFEVKGSAGGIQVVDDYGHHPVEVRATLAAAREAHPGRIVTVFQPHRFTRTRDCFDDFTTSFGETDVLIVTDTYSAGEPVIPGAEATRLADAIRKSGHTDVRFISRLDEIAEDLPASLVEGDLVLTLGAGDVSTLGPHLLETLRDRAGSDAEVGR